MARRGSYRDGEVRPRAARDRLHARRRMNSESRRINSESEEVRCDHLHEAQYAVRHHLGDVERAAGGREGEAGGVGERLVRERLRTVDRDASCALCK